MGHLRPNRKALDWTSFRSRSPSCAPIARSCPYRNPLPLEGVPSLRVDDIDQAVAVFLLHLSHEAVPLLDCLGNVPLHLVAFADHDDEVGRSTLLSHCSPPLSSRSRR